MNERRTVLFSVLSRKERKGIAAALFVPGAGNVRARTSGRYAKFCPRFFVAPSPSLRWSAAHRETSRAMTLTTGLFLRASYFVPLVHTTPLDAHSLRFIPLSSSHACTHTLIYTFSLFLFLALSLSLPENPTYELITAPNRSSAAAGLKYPLAKGWRAGEWIPATNLQRSVAGGEIRRDWPRELITRPICAKSRRVIARRGLLLALGAL